MRYIIATYSNGYCGCDETEYWAFEDNITDKDIEEFLYESFSEYANLSLPCGVDFENDDDWEAYLENCTVDFYDATPKEIEEIGTNIFTHA